MKTKILDVKALKTITPAGLMEWLRHAGWAISGELAGRHYAFAKARGVETFEVEVPATQSFRDYARRMAEILDVLEAAEGKDQTVLFGDIHRAQTALFRRKQDPKRKARLEATARKQAMMNAFVICGYVVAIESDEVSKGGTIHILAVAQRRKRRIAVVLARPDYVLAVEAHLAGRRLGLDGELVAVARKARVINPHNVSIVDV